MIFLDETKNLKVYNKPFFLPFDETNKKLGSAIFLLTPNYESSKKTMNLPYLINRNYFQSYYMERNINYTINSGLMQKESVKEYNGTAITYAEYMTESLSTSQRKNLKDSSFGLPSKRKYPLHDAKHVKSAIRFFNYVDKEDEVELARNINKAIKKFHMAVEVGENNRFSKYYNESMILESEDKSKLANNYKSKGNIKLSDLKAIRIHDPNTIQEEYNNSNEDEPYHTKFAWYFINDKKIKWAGIDEDLTYPNFEDAIRNANKIQELIYKKETSTVSLYVYTANCTYIGSISVTVSDGDIVNWEWIEQEDISLQDIQEAYNLDMQEDIVNILDKTDKSRIFITSDWHLLNWKYTKLWLKKSDKNIDEDSIVKWCKANIKDNDVFLYLGDLADKRLDEAEDKARVQEIYKSLPGIKILVLGNHDMIQGPEFYGNCGFDYIINEIEYKNIIFTHKPKMLSGTYPAHFINIHGHMHEERKYCDSKDIDRCINVYPTFYNNKPTTLAYILSHKQVLTKDNYYSDNIYNESYKKFNEGISLLEKFSTKKLDASYLRRHMKYGFGKRKIHKFVTLKSDDQEEVLDGSEETPVDNITNDLDESLYIKTDNSIIFTEDASEDAKLKKILYQDRIRQDKQVKEIYKRVKEENDFIIYTFISLDKYKKKNIYVDLSYYNNSFFKNNMYRLDKGVNLYLELLDRLINNPKYKNTGYNKRTVFIPISDWGRDDKTKMWMYNEGINPISTIFRSLKTNPAKVKAVFKDITIVFMSDRRYFKVDFSKIDDVNKFNTKFKQLIINLLNNTEINLDDVDSTPKNVESKKAIVANIVDKLETSQGIKINNLTGTEETTPEEIEKKVSNGDIKASDEKEIDKKEKEKLIQAINKVADNSINTDDALDKMDDDAIKQIIINLASQEEEAVKINQARASRMLKLQNDVYSKKIKNKTVKEILEEDKNTKDDPLESTSLKNKITSIEEDWNDLRFINFDKDYDINADIIKMLNKLSTTTYPIAVRDITVVDNSTSEDYVDLYTVQMEDFRGKRFTIKFDVPKFRNDRYLFLRGNQKTIQNQFFNMPIIKTDDDTCQIITNYQKIFIRRFGTSSGKSFVTAGRILKAIEKYDGKKIKIKYNDCSKVSEKFELPIDYIDIGTSIEKIETPTYIIFFNQEEIRSKYTDDIDLSRGLPFAIDKSSTDKDSIIYFDGNAGVFSNKLKSMLYGTDERLDELYDATKPAVRYTYSKASILNTEIPLVVVCAFSEGLETTMKKGNIEYKLVEKITKEIREDFMLDWIKFNDGYLVYKLDYASSLLMNGLKACNTSDFSLSEINSQNMYLDFLDNFGGRLKADGLSNYYDSMIDPITEEVLQHYELPTDYIEILLHANSLLADNKYIKHTDTSSRRLRRKELIAAKVYKVLFYDAYATYATQLRHSKGSAQFSVKQSAVIDKFMLDPAASDNSIVNAINDVETTNAVTTKGENGLNSDRAYSLDKRTYDESMLNVLGMSTGFAGNVGITRQGTVDMNIDGKRGYIKSIDGNVDKLSTAKSLTITEALNPMGTTSDSPMRTAMTFIQTAKHAMRTNEADPLLVTNGSDEAMPYLVSDTFAFKAKEDGVIKEVVENKYIIVEYKNGEKEYINLEETIEKNSDGGFYVPMKLSTSKGIVVGKKVKKNDIIAYDKSSFSNTVGETDNISFNVGTLAKVAVLCTDECFEDSTVLTESICERMATNYIVKENRILPKDTNIFNIVKVGQHIEEGGTLLVYQNPYEEEDMNLLLKNLVSSEEEISELGRVPIKSHVTGTVAGIKLYRTVELDELSDSLRALFEEYEKPIKKMKAKLDKEKIQSSTLPPTYALPATGKLKNAVDSVLIEIYVNVYDIIAIGDKIVLDRANKGVTKDIIPDELAPYTDFRPNEEISCFAGVCSFNKRMVTSVLKIGSMNKLLIELDRSVKDILGIPYDDSKI